ELLKITQLIHRYYILSKEREKVFKVSLKSISTFHSIVTGIQFANKFAVIRTVKFSPLDVISKQIKVGRYNYPPDSTIGIIKRMDIDKVLVKSHNVFDGICWI